MCSTCRFSAWYCMIQVIDPWPGHARHTCIIVLYIRYYFTCNRGLAAESTCKYLINRRTLFNILYRTYIGAITETKV